MNGIRICKTRAGLDLINKMDIELVIWKRSFSSSFQDWINHTDAENLPDFRILINSNELRPALEPLLDSCGLKADDMRGQLVNDIKGLVNMFANITQSNVVDVRLQRITNNACWKFHRDVVKTRLVTTYRGPTTEWVQHAQAEQAILEQLDYKGPLEHLGDGDVAIFKGSVTHPNRGIVHRSPSIAGTDITRLLLCLNQQTDTSPEPWVVVKKNQSHPKVMRSNEIVLTE
jgi:hypothetical protein